MSNSSTSDVYIADNDCNKPAILQCRSFGKLCTGYYGRTYHMSIDYRELQLSEARDNKNVTPRNNKDFRKQPIDLLFHQNHI